MIAKLFSFTLIFYYLFGTMCLPFSDFSYLSELPSMYDHCKTTEDAELTPFDFITDHLICLNSVFDEHEEDGGEKPHQPAQLHHVSTAASFFLTQIVYALAQPVIENQMKSPNDVFCSCGIKSEVFRPPIMLS